MPEWKDTVNLPRTDFPMKANLPTSEPDTLARWTAMDLYGRIRARRKGAPKFVLHDGPPYANGNIHMGTALNKILKELVVKSRSMAGFDAPYVVGYDCHGLPIELKVDRELGPKKRDMSVADFCRACRAYAERYVGTMSEQFQRLGILGDLGPALPDDELQVSGARSRAPSAGSWSRGSSTRARSRCTGASTAGPRWPKPKSSTSDHSSPSIYVEFPLAPESAVGTRPPHPGAGRPAGLGPHLDDDAVDDSVEPGDRVPSRVRLRGVRGRRARGHRRRRACAARRGGDRQSRSASRSRR